MTDKTYFVIYNFDTLDSMGEWFIGDIFTSHDDALEANGGVEVNRANKISAIVEISRERLVKDLMFAHLYLLPDVALEMIARMRDFKEQTAQMAKQ